MINDDARISDVSLRMKKSGIKDFMTLHQVIVPIMEYIRPESFQFQEKFLRDIIFNLIKTQFAGNPTDMLIFFGKLSMIMDSYNREFYTKENVDRWSGRKE